MGKFSGVLLCTDLDDTLLDQNKNISAENINAIEYFKSNGGCFTFITGRGVNSTAKSIDAAKPNVPIGCLNGGSIYDIAAGKTIYEAELDRGVTALLCELENQFENLGVEIVTHKNTYFHRKNARVLQHMALENLPDYTAADFDEIQGKWGKCLLVDDPKSIDIVINYISKCKNAENFDFVRSCGHFYEILPKGASKGTLLIKIADILGIENTIAVGDNENDISMFKAAKIGIAVENAVPAAKKNADIVTVKNTENAIAKIIYDLDNGIIKF